MKPLGTLSGFLLLFAMQLLAGCQAGYYAHLLRGELDLLRRGEPVAQVIADPATDPQLRERLRLAQRARAFALQTLRLPDTGSYTRYADLGRPYVLWNVFATPELSLEPETWCHLLVGCLGYRGYYRESMARDEAARLASLGLDTWVGGVPAYSTLGWFSDPLLNTMGDEDIHWVGTIFHELAHQRRYVTSDTMFNESFASFVEDEGLRQFTREDRALAARAREHQERDRQGLELLAATRLRLEAVYASSLDDEAKRAAKSREFAALRQAFERRGWVAGPLNNARLAPVGLYRQWVPAFQTLFARCGRDWERFYDATLDLARLDPAERKSRLEDLSKGG